MKLLSALIFTSLFSISAFAGHRSEISPRESDFLSLEFGEVYVGKFSQFQIGLNAPKDKELLINELYIVGEMFTATTNCGDRVAAGKYCAINILFTPQAKGDHYGELGIKTTEGNVLLRLYGTGL